MSLALRKFLTYVIGILILTLGIALTIQSKMGTSPFDALLVGLFRSFGLTIGSWEIIVGLTMVLLNAIAQKKRPEYLALLTSLITGAGIDFWVFLLHDWLNPATLIGQLVCVNIGILLSGLGIAVYLQADYAPNPIDRMMLVIRNITGLNVSLSRTLINVILVLLAVGFSGPIGIGTLLNAIFSGIIINFFMGLIKHGYLFSTTEAH
ncbi:MAG: YitT family protein [Firmicutes bacterium]|nr:YitT family protein [Bacillota bacterium]